MTSWYRNVILGLVMSLVPGVAAAQSVALSYSLEGDTVVVTDATGEVAHTSLPCTGEALTEHEGRLYIACGEDGLLVLDLSDPISPTVLQQRNVGGRVVGFFDAQGRVWAEIVRVEAQPLQALEGADVPPRQVTVVVDAPPGPTTPEAAAPVAAPAVLSGRILEVESGGLIIDLGSEHGLVHGQHIEIFLEEQVELGAGHAALRQQRVAIGEVTAVSEDRAHVALGLNERVPSDALVRPTSADLTGSVWVPPRAGGLWGVEFVARPFLSLGSVGFGLVSDGELVYRLESPVSLRLLLAPIGIGLAEEGNIVSFAANFIVAYDTDAFEIGLGLGWSIVNDELVSDSFGSAEASDGISLEFDRVKDGLSIAQYARLGSRDGFFVEAVNTFILTDEEFVYGGTRSTMQVPLGEGVPGLWIMLRGGGGLAGYAFGEAGLRVLLTGNGDRGSVFVTPTIGGAYLQGEEDDTCEYYDYSTNTTQVYDCSSTIEYGGPMVGFGVEWRL